MRLTNVLFRVNYHRHFKRIWKRQGKMEIKDLVIPPELQAMGIEIKEGKDILDETKFFKPVKQPVGLPYPECLPYPLPPSAFTPKMPYYRMHSQINVTEGMNQAFALTKTIPYDGLPLKIESLIGLDSLPNQDELVQINILQSHVWNAALDRLPRPFNPEKPCFGTRRPRGIHFGKKVAGLLDKLSYLCDAATGKYSNCFDRSKHLNAFCETAIERSGCNIAFQMECDIMLKAKKPLERFASLAEVKETENQIVPDIYPIKPTLDLDKCHENPLTNCEIHYDSSLGRIHTLFLAQTLKGNWPANQQMAKAIATCFAFAAAEARFKYGNDVKILPEPISVQCMFLDVYMANFLAYQLNTLETEHDDGIKNQAWIDRPISFCTDISEANLVSNYDPSMFSKMLAFHTNGFQSQSGY